MHSRENALLLARRHRTCPSTRTIAREAGTAHLERHLSRCDYCSAGKDGEAPDPWHDLAAALKEAAAFGNTPESLKEPRPGELRQIAESQSRWRGDDFYSAPLVLVLGSDPERPGCVRVAQIYDDLSLAAPGDLIVRDETFIPDEFFIECWNQYAVPAVALGPAVEILPEALVRAVDDLARDPAAYPEGSLLPRPLKDADPRRDFRELETAVAGIFSEYRESEAEALAVTPNGLSLAYSTVSELAQSLREKISALSWPSEPLSLEQALGTFRFPAEMLRFAASGPGPKAVPARVVLIEAGRAERLLPATAEIFLDKFSEGVAIIGGRVRGIPEALHGGVFLCFMVREGRVLNAARRQWSDEDRSFLAEFEGEREGSEELCIAVVFERDGKA